jgi:hypothetical protein
MLKAFHEVVSKAGANMSDASRQSVLGLIDGDADNTDGRLETVHQTCSANVVQIRWQSQMLVFLEL